MNVLSLMVDQSLGGGRFVVTSNCRSDIPVGTVFTTLFSERKKYVEQTFVLEDTGPTLGVCLKIISVEFWRKPYTCVPYGHHAGVQFDGTDIEILESYLAEHPTPWHVFLDSDGVARP